MTIQHSCGCAGKTWQQRAAGKRAITIRNKMILRLASMGYTLKGIGRRYNLSPGAVHKIITRLGGIKPIDARRERANSGVPQL